MMVETVAAQTMMNSCFPEWRVVNHNQTCHRCGVSVSDEHIPNAHDGKIRSARYIHAQWHLMLEGVG